MNAIIFSAFLTLASYSANAGIIQVAPSNNTLEIAKFASDIEAKLPQKMKDTLSTKKITLTFSNIKNDSNQIQIPNCVNTIDSFTEADAVIAEYAKAQDLLKGKSLRYNKQIYSYTDKNNNIVMNAGFLPIISAGEYAAKTYACEHRNLFKLAQGSLINALAAIYDDATATTVNTGNKTKRVSGISESLKYKTIAGWSKKGKRNNGFWPRAVNLFEFAGGPGEHFAQNMEFYLLDPEYACRRPLQQDFFSRHFNNHDPLAAQRTCKVNYVLRIPKTRSLEAEDKIIQSEVKFVDYDMSPEKVFNVNYLRAGASTGAGSFGHSMFRFLTCAPGQTKSSECGKEFFSLVVNPRANPLEMRLETMRGIFGGYPSQFLITPLNDIRIEYGRSELRHLYNVPLTGGSIHDPATNQTVEVLPEDQKVRFIQATIDQYWSYYGRYKFISNNCADESMRLYQMSSDDEQVLNLDVLLPQDFNKKLARMGLADEAKTKGLEPSHGIFRKLIGAIIKKDMKWDQFEIAYNNAAAVGDASTHLSFNYNIMKSIRNIMILEGRPEKEYNSSKGIQKESKKWVAIASPSLEVDEVELKYYMENKKVSEKKLAEINETLNNIKNRYAALIAKAKTPADKENVSISFYHLIYLILEKRKSEIGSEAVQMAYAVAYPKNEKDDIRAKLEPNAYTLVKNAIDRFAETQRALMPYREFSTMPGYGIPLANEVTRGKEFSKLMSQENEIIDQIIESLGPLIGPDREIIGQLELLKIEMVKNGAQEIPLVK
ncbi:MAG: DUF4105 domain-containing protein [Bdellovibrionota bacterium]